MLSNLVFNVPILCAVKFPFVPGKPQACVHIYVVIVEGRDTNHFRDSV